MNRLITHTIKTGKSFLYRRSGKDLSLWFILVLLAEIPVLSSYLINTAETSAQDLLLPLLLNFLTATIIAAICLPLFRRNSLRYYLVAICLTFLATDSLMSRLSGITSTLSSLLPFQAPIPLVGAAYAVVIIYLIWLMSGLVQKHVAKRHWRTGEVMIPVGLAIIGFFLAEFVPTATTIVEAWPQFFYKPPVLSATTSASTKPDIYYILLEDYASQTVLKNQLNFDNADFMNQLSDDGFSNVPDAKANYPYTVNSVASTFAANYLSDPVNNFSAAASQSLIPYFSTVKQSPVVSQLKAMGYSYDLLGDWYETSNSSPLADHTYTNDDQIVFLNHTYSLNDFTDAQIQKNILWTVISSGITIGHYRVLGYNAQDDVSMVKAQLAQLRKLAAQPAGGRFIFSQILAPHNYFYFNPDGSNNSNPAPDNNGELATTKYTNEIQYINTQIEPIITEIMKNSGGKANIIIQSDEGLSMDLLNSSPIASSLDKSAGNMTKWSPAALQTKFGILASYYVPGASPDELATAANPVNIFRLILNTNFGAQLPYLPLCYYGYPQGESEAFVYQNINQALTGQANAACPANGNFINPGPTKLIPHAKASSEDDGNSDND